MNQKLVKLHILVEHIIRRGHHIFLPYVDTILYLYSIFDFVVNFITWGKTCFSSELEG